MERRSFLKALAGGSAVTQFVPKATAAQAPSLDDLRIDLEAADGDAAYWARVREEFDSLDYTYLNCSTIGVTPRSVVQAMVSYLQQLETYPRGYVFGGFPTLGYATIVSRATEFLGARTGEVWITPNTTQGMNHIAEGLELAAGDEVLLTDQEHPGGYLGWEFRQRDGVRVVRMPMPTFVEGKDQILELVKDHLTAQTKVVMVSHIMTETGLVMPIPEIAEIVHGHGILLVVDGAHGPGMLNVNVKDLGADAYASSSHKWMLAPKGSGLLYIDKNLQNRVHSAVLSGGTGIYSAIGGTPNAVTVAGHGEAMRFHNLIGRDRVEARVRQLQGYLRERMIALPGVRPLAPVEMAAGVTSYAFEQGDTSSLFSSLRQRMIDVKAEPHNSLRLSTHVLNSEDEIDLLMENLKDLMGLTTAVEEPQASAPKAASLSPNYPNPFNATTQIPFELSRDGFVTIDVVDAVGQVVATPVDGFYAAGAHRAVWEATGLATGAYFTRMRTDGVVQTRKMALVR